MTRTPPDPPHRTWCATDHAVYQWIDATTGATIVVCRSCRAELISAPHDPWGAHDVPRTEDTR
jgi:hypothetical protein